MGHQSKGRARYFRSYVRDLAHVFQRYPTDFITVFTYHSFRQGDNRNDL